MSTETTTRKYPNILANPQASVVIGGLNNDPSIQIDGQIKVLQGPSADEAKTTILSLHPDLAAYINTPNTKFLAFTPNWLRYSDFSQNPPEITELTNF
jgi:general stress protein 26